MRKEKAKGINHDNFRLTVAKKFAGKLWRFLSNLGFLRKTSRKIGLIGRHRLLQKIRSNGRTCLFKTPTRRQNFSRLITQAENRCTSSNALAAHLIQFIFQKNIIQGNLPKEKNKSKAGLSELFYFLSKQQRARLKLQNGIPLKLSQ